MHGYVTTELAAPRQKVRGVMVVPKDNQRLGHSLVIVHDFASIGMK